MLKSKFKVLGGKLIGAGGGGFIWFVQGIKNSVKIWKNNINFINLNIEKFGSKIINH